ncbi:DUF2953 domain-containing protein [Bariatricus sp. SGI.154]|uniref:DUF2953 domain-containing protein n=1 Tax=Bariatricus sp. SGI.154 TaxID=3420549 RepID=UPI003CFE8154
MLHILLLILKIIGIIIAAILGILVLLIGIVLFVPVRYEAKGEFDGTLEGIDVRAKVTWLLHLVKVTVCYENQELSWRIRIAWKHIQSGQEDEQTMKEEVGAYEEELDKLLEDAEEEPYEEERPEDFHERSAKEVEQVEKDIKEASKEREESMGSSEEDLEKGQEESLEADNEGSKSITEKIAEESRLSEGIAENFQEDEKAVEEAEANPDQEMEDSESGSRKERKNVWQKITGICKKVIRKIGELYHKIESFCRKTGTFYEKIKCTIQNICDKIKALSEKKDKIMDFISDETHKKAFLKVKKEVFRLLRKLKPKKLEANIHYGFEDPYYTGKLLAGVSILYPLIGENVIIQPDFEQKVFKGNFEIAGKIRMSYFVKLLWNLVWCKEVRMTYRHVRKFEL